MGNVTGQFIAIIEEYVVTSVTIGFMLDVLIYPTVSTLGYPVVLKIGYAVVVMHQTDDRYTTVVMSVNVTMSCHNSNICILMGGKQRLYMNNHGHKYT